MKWGPAVTVVLLGLAALVVVHALGCSTSSATSDGSVEGGGGGTSAGGTSGGAGNTGSGGAASGGTSGASGTGSGGASGNSGKTYGCGSGTCTVGQSFCYSYTPGTPGGGTGSSCKATPSTCAANPTCACLCPPTSSASVGCTPVAGNGLGGFCSCTDANGFVDVSCAGS